MVVPLHNSGRTKRVRERNPFSLWRGAPNPCSPLGSSNPQHIQRSGSRKNYEVSVKLVVSFVCFVVCLSAAAPARSQEIRDGQALLAAMHERYKDSWYDSVVFKEKTITLNPDGTSKTEIWDEALQLPGKLRINKGPSSEGNGFVFVDGALTTFQKGKASGTRPYVHMLLVLGFDVYRQDAKTTIDQVKGQGFDLTKIHAEKWEGQDAYVVGALKGDLKSKQFWIEKNQLLFVRLIEPDEHDAARIHDSQFRDYRKLSIGWISARVEFYTDGKNIFNEDYFDIKANAKCEPALFEPKKFNETTISNNANQ